MREHVEKATVRVARRCGQGVLVPGGFVLTAARCIELSCDEGGMVLGDDYFEEIEAGGKTLKIRPCSVEPVSDIAVLGALDRQEFFQESEDFERLCESIEPVALYAGEFEPFTPFSNHIRTHKGTWATGKAQLCNPEAYMLWIEADEQIEGGTSGGPIVNDEGKLVGIYSNSNIGRSQCNGTAPIPHLTIPPWPLRRIVLE